jgi:glutathione S-transferase
MAAPYRLFGSELSPYSVKVRSYFRYKQVPHEWVLRNRDTQAEFDAHARLPLIPLVVGPDGWAMQDSTPILRHFESLYPVPALDPEDPVLRFLSALIEEYADEWVNKPMFHYRWAGEPDQRSAAERIAHARLPGADAAAIEAAASAVRERMVARRPLVGSTADTADQIEASLARLLAVLERHLDGRLFLFGSRPALADFGLAAQLYEMATDPTPGRIIRDRAPGVLRWVHRMLEPRAEGPFEAWDTLRPTLRPLLSREIGETFLPWSVANAKALTAGSERFTVTLDDAPFTQAPVRYQARSLAQLIAAYRENASAALDAVLADAGCLKWLQVG